MRNGETEIKEDVWVHTHCARCYGVCALRVHRVNGVAVEIQGEPDVLWGQPGAYAPKDLPHCSSSTTLTG
ncbi:MAG: hypothetical protein AABZ77_05030 [Chloroflexota bacterium]